MGLQNSGRISLKEIGDEFATYLLVKCMARVVIDARSKLETIYGKSSAVGMAQGEHQRMMDTLIG